MSVWAPLSWPTIHVALIAVRISFPTDSIKIALGSLHTSGPYARMKRRSNEGAPMHRGTFVAATLHPCVGAGRMQAAERNLDAVGGGRMRTAINATWIVGHDKG